MESVYDKKVIFVNNNNNNNVLVKVNFVGKKFKEFNINKELTVASFKQMLFSYFNIDFSSYLLLYRNKKLSINDVRLVGNVFNNELGKALVFIVNINDYHKMKMVLKHENFTSGYVVKQNIPQVHFYKMLSRFFKFKGIPFEVQVNKYLGYNKGYDLNFQSVDLAKDFNNFYALYRESNCSNNTYHKNVSNSNVNKEISLPNIHSKSLNSAPTNSIEDDLSYNNVCNSTKNKSSSYTNSKRSSNGVVKNKNFKMIRSVSNTYMGPEERRLHLAYLDKKNWICNKPFKVSVGNYSKGGETYIKNYVSMSKSEPPVIHQYRDVNKTRWITQTGFC